ncbi:uncharacterized protein Ecym_1079 [Eremothecium cymbalariae DBVPG|uniref:Uncharacterized protein n=1 Tax=Eremothecium cymbalariae (strain CBS 270.75 / DBVPG 7215 / KCTC 17166 / NRRL Y-17582) TaxID=931890 RepID=G8JMC8_ERECY|nr:hypothetical protein Ecym_1079 [Eremothecium cymbalariae DBVPG\
MIPPPVDSALLREHSYEDKRLLDIVLNSQKYSSTSGYKPIKDYGLGYFNYIFAMEKGIGQVRNKDIFRDHLYRYFNFYFSVWLVIFMVWFLYVFGSPSSLDKMSWRIHSKKKSDDDTVTMYHHMKV